MSVDVTIWQSPWILGAILLLALAGVLLNLFFVITALRIRRQVMGLRTTVTSMLQGAIDDLQGFENLAMHFTVHVDESMPLRTRLPIKDQLRISLHSSVPVRQTLTSDIIVNAPLLNTRLPLTVAVPIDIEVPIDLNVPILIDTDIPVNLMVPVKLTVPVKVELGKTELGAFVEQVRTGLITLRELLNSAAGRL